MERFGDFVQILALIKTHYAEEQEKSYTKNVPTPLIAFLFPILQIRFKTPDM